MYIHLKRGFCPNCLLHCHNNSGKHFKIVFFKKKIARAGEQTRDILISFIFSFHLFTAEPQWLTKHFKVDVNAVKYLFCGQGDQMSL
jgi:hypothetical protein